jgi:hypothetical protein
LSRLTQYPQDSRAVEALAFTVLTETHRCHILRRTDTLNGRAGLARLESPVLGDYCVQSPRRFPDIFMTIACGDVTFIWPS